ncbi:MAG: exodeoxyribonuclease V subunit alpha, partial [Burkholderiales bacterium]
MNADERDPIATPALALAEGFARHASDWSRAQGAAEPIVRAAGLAARTASLALSDGHVCVMLRELPPVPSAAGATGDAGAAGAAGVAATLGALGVPGTPGAADASHVPGEHGTRGASADADTSTWRQTLLASRVVGTPDAPGAMPLVLDADGRLYLHRYFDYERRLAQRLLRAAESAVPITDAGQRAALRTQLAELFAANTARLAGEADWQMIAAALALRSRLTVISGGPGTGKTTTVVNLLACLLGQNPGCRIALAAPTGKAAARMSEAIRERAAHLPEAIRTRLPAEASTIHRLLGVTPRGVTHHAGNRLPIDALVVDEASMLDLALATRLLEAVPEGARIVLLGDKDQLAAVESGAVFAELCTDPTLSAACRDDLADLCGIAPERIVAPAAIETSLSNDASALRDDATPRDGLARHDANALRGAMVLHDATVWFTRNFRFDAESGIGRLAAAINAGRADAALAILGDAVGETQGGSQGNAGPPQVSLFPLGGADAARRRPWGQSEAELQWLDDDSAQLSPTAIERLANGYAPFFDAVLRDAAQPSLITDAFSRFRVLCAVRESARGVAAVIDELTQRLRERLGALDRNPRSPWFPGRPVLVRRNDAVLKLFNGDVGITLPDANGDLLVHFPQSEGGSRTIAPLRLPEHETAFAMTVHKAQGSEFDAVFVLLPGKANRVLTRELLYTAVTRARKRVTLCAGAAMLTAAIEARTRRHSGLLAR